MARDASKVIGGPAQVLIDDANLAHTQGGIMANFSPKTRAVKVDEFGESEMFFRHTGDEVRVDVPFAEYTAAVLAIVYGQGKNETAAVSGAKYLGWGRSAGFILPDVELEIRPLLSADAAKAIFIPKAVSIGQLQLGYKVDADTILQCQFAGTVDETATDGEAIGKIQLTAGS